MKLAVILLFLALTVEAWAISLPLVMLVLIPVTVIYKDNLLFVLAFVFGILLDMLSFKTIGYSSAFFCILIFLILMYERKFEIHSNYFVIFAAAISSLFFGVFYNYPNIFLGTIVSTILAVTIYMLFKMTIAKGEVHG